MKQSTKTFKLTKNLNLGTAGEHYVAANFLRLGFNVSIPHVDTGVDLHVFRTGIYTNDKHSSEGVDFYQIQVKTTSNNKKIINLTKKKFTELIENAVNLIVVFWAKALDPCCVVIPHRLLLMLTQDKDAPIKMTNKIISIRLELLDGDIFVGNRDNPITLMKNRFDLINSWDDEPNVLPEYAYWSSVKGRLVDIDEELLPPIEDDIQ